MTLSLKVTGASMRQALENDDHAPARPAVTLTAAPAARRFTTKQMGDACEMLVAAELTLAGIPALKVPDNWPHYDVIAQPDAGPALRISVKSRTFRAGPAYVEYRAGDQFDWLAIVILSPGRDIYMVPRSVADAHARRDRPTSKTAELRYFRIDEVERLFGCYRGNFTLTGFDNEFSSAASRESIGRRSPKER